MDWKAETLARTRRARLQANNLWHSLSDLNYSLCKLEEYDSDPILLTGVVKIVNGLEEDLFRLEEELSRSM